MVADISGVIGLDGKGGTFFLRRLRRGQNKPECYNFVKKTGLINGTVQHLKNTVVRIPKLPFT
jgi:hypothetical protein